MQGHLYLRNYGEAFPKELTKPMQVVAGCRLRWNLLSNPGRWQQYEPNAGSTPYLAEWTQRLRSLNELPD